jgi:predicted house-cleaning NTP pyrophosphatase (Maf/HAM1 superfamily)
MNMETTEIRPNDPAENIKSERARELLHVWRERTPVILKSSSAIRKNGLIEKAGFNPDNIRVIVSPDSAEENVFKTASADSRLAEVCAAAKGELLESVPPEAIVFVFDTLVVRYSECTDPT